MCLSLVLCLVLGVSCGTNEGNEDTSQQENYSTDKDSDNDTTDADDSQGDTAEVTDEDGNVVTPSTSSAADAESTSDDVYVTDADGNIVTDANGNAFVTEAVTDADGSIVTDDDGNTVTQKVSVITTAKNSNGTSSNDGATTNSNNNSDANGNGNTTTVVTNNGGNSSDNNSSSQTNAVLTVTENGGNAVVTTTTVTQDTSPYFAKNRYSAFNWMSTDAKNRYDSGEIAEITFKVADDAKTGTYPIEITYTDISNEKAELLTFPAINGTITVGTENKVETQGAASSTSFRLDNGYAKPGDTVTIKIYLDNNPGVSIFQVEFKYDNNALEVQSIIPSGIFANESILSNMNFSQ